jgi:uncharacterized membrane protein
MQRSIVLLVSGVTLALAACGPVPGLGPLFGPDSGATLLFLAVIGLLVYGVARLRQRKTDLGPRTESGHRHNGEPAIQILRERYAKGEISRAEYLQSLNDLVQN